VVTAPRTYLPLSLELVLEVRSAKDRQTQVYFAWELVGACFSVYPGPPSGLVGSTGPGNPDLSQIPFSLADRFSDSQAEDFARTHLADEPGKVQGIITGPLILKLLAWAVGIALGV
jgi:hypothetical protein